MVDIEVDPGCTLNKKIRNAQLAQYNFILGKKGSFLKKICLDPNFQENSEILRLRLQRIVVVSSVPSKSWFFNNWVYSFSIRKEILGVENNNP